MGFLERVHQQRSFTLTGSVRDPALARLLSGGRASAAGPLVNEFTMFTCAAVFNAVDQIASDLAKLPLDLKKRLDAGGADDFVDAKAYKLLKFAPNPECTSMVFRRTLMLHALVSKGGFAEIERDGADRPTALWFLESNRVAPFYDRGAVAPDGRKSPLRYRVDGKEIFEARDILHIQGLGPDVSGGFEMVQIAREAIGLALASQAFAAAFFGNGTRFGGILMAKDRDLDPGDEDSKAITAAVESLHTRADKAFRLLVLGAGFEYKETGVRPNEAQMKEIRDQQVMEIARFFNMPLHKLKLAIAGAVSYSSVEMFDLDYYKGPILTWSTLWEQELNAKLVPRLEWGRQFFKHNVRAFLRADFKSQNEGLALARVHGVVNADEWREYLDMNPQPNGQGKLYLVQSAQVPMDKLVELTNAQIEKVKQPPPAPAAAPGDTPDDRQMREQLAAAEARVLAAEQLATEARAEADRERDTRIAIEASGAASAEQLAAAVAREQDANARAVQFGALSETLRADHAAMLLARDTLAQQLAEEQSARGAAERAAHEATERATAAADAEQRAVAAAEDAREDAAVARAAADEATRLEQEARAALAAREAPCTICNDVGLLPERGMSDPVGQLPCSCPAGVLQAARIQAQVAVGQAEAASAARDTAERSVVEAIAEAARAAALAEEAQARVADLEAAQTASAERAAVLTSDLDATRASLAVAEQARVDAEAAAGEATAEAARVAALAAEADARAAALEASEAAAVAQRALGASELAALRASTEAAEQARVDAERVAEEARAAAAEERTRLADLVTSTRRAEISRLTSVLTAHRGLIVEAMGRMIRWETSKARRHQATPEKLRGWIDSYYVTHEDTCCDALLPAVRVHLAWQQSAEDPVTVTREVVREHIAESVRQLRAVANADQDELHALLERMLQRWEDERPAALADRILREEIDYVRAYQV